MGFKEVHSFLFKKERKKEKNTNTQTHQTISVLIEAFFFFFYQNLKIIFFPKKIESLLLFTLNGHFLKYTLLVLDWSLGPLVVAFRAALTHGTDSTFNKVLETFLRDFSTIIT